MRKRILTVFSALAITAASFGMAFAADGEAPMAMDVATEDNTLTVTLKSAEEFDYANFKFEFVDVPDGATYKGGSFVGRDAFGGAAIINPTEPLGNIMTDDVVNNVTVPAGSDFATLTFDIADLNYGDYTFTVLFDTAADIDGNSLDWEGAEITTKVTKATPPDAEEEKGGEKTDDSTPDDKKDDSTPKDDEKKDDSTPKDDESTPESNDSTSESKDDEPKTAPKTGDATSIAVLALVAGAGLAGAVVLKKKED